MPDVLSLRAEMEQDLSWRQDEIRFLFNQLTVRHILEPLSQSVIDDIRTRRLQRVIIMMLYAHFEGYCKFALLVYVRAINESQLLVRDGSSAVAACTISRELAALRDPSSKSDLFRRTSPDDSKLHLLSREQEFVERLAELDARIVFVPDEVVDTESNLKPVVLQKILFRLGLDINFFSTCHGSVDKLLRYRNAIAHGNQASRVADADLLTLRADVYRIMNEVTIAITRALHSRKYRREAQVVAVAGEGR